MDVSDAVHHRKSVRAFLDTPVPDETVRALLTAAARAPSGGNVQPWRMYVVNGDRMTDFLTFMEGRDFPTSLGIFLETPISPFFTRILFVYMYQAPDF